MLTLHSTHPPFVSEPQEQLRRGQQERQLLPWDSRGQDGLGYPLVNISFFFLIPRINANPKPLLSHSLIKSLVVVCFLGRLSTVPPELGCRKSEVPGMCLSSPLNPQWLLKSSPAEAENNKGNQVVQSGPFSSASATHFEHPAFQLAPGFLVPPIWNKEATALALHHGTHPPASGTKFWSRTNA